MIIIKSNITTQQSINQDVRYIFNRLAIIIFVFCINSVIALSQVKDISIGNQQWLHYYNQTRLGDKFVWLADGGYRWKDGFQENSQYITRTALGYFINPNLQISAGFAHLGFHSSGKINKVEFRPFQELIIKNKVKKFDLNHRIRIEERIFYPVYKGKIQNSSVFNFRFRYAFTISIPLFKLSKENTNRIFSINLGDEIFINVGENNSYKLFYQNRLIISPTIYFSKNLAVSITWNSQFSSTSTKKSYKYADVLWIQIKHKLNIKKPLKN
ncbi:MAG: DUF2490 domain-containing protein [Bacteroidetes bacterium]|nr:MAG: DUF2490 domain-containing protein [Bacteroidota bacterium]MBL1144715.1 DUF2490 domain-containing protein [Bacteroidota bacterium]NOG57509.1 DUF2490 domain-containing protein [Bacteroidota bacterium]